VQPALATKLAFATQPIFGAKQTGIDAFFKKKG